MKILYLNSLRNYGGGEKHTWLLMRGLRERGWNVHLATPPESPLGTQARAEGFAVHEVAFRSKWDVASMIALYRLMRRERFDVVHAQDHRSALLGVPAARLAGAPTRLISVHMLNTERAYPPMTGLKRSFYCGINRLLMRLATGVIAISRWNREALRREGVPVRKVRTIYPGIDLREFARPGRPQEPDPLAGLPEDAPVVGVVGRLERQKGIDILLSAFPTVLERHPEAYLIVVGDGPERAGLEAQAAEIGLDGRARFAGFRDDVAALLPRFTLLAMPSFFEGLPVVPLEAYMAGVPTVATAVYGNPEVVIDRTTGLLVPPGEPARLADALSSLLNDATWRAEMAEAGKKLLMERFSLETMLDATESYYRELLAAKSSRVPAATEVQHAGR